MTRLIVDAGREGTSLFLEPFKRQESSFDKVCVTDVGPVDEEEEEDVDTEAAAGYRWRMGAAPEPTLALLGITGADEVRFS